MTELDRIHRCNRAAPKPPVEVGDLVWTQFFSADTRLPRRVTAVSFAREKCNSGWWIETVDDQGRVLSCDSRWFRLPLGGRVESAERPSFGDR